MGESHGMGAGAAGFGGAAGLAPGGAEDAAAAGFGATDADAGSEGFSAGDLESDPTEPEAVAFTPPGTVDLSAVGFGSPSGGGEEGDLISSGISGEGTDLRRAGFPRER